MSNVAHPKLAWLSAAVGALGIVALAGASFGAYRISRALGWAPSASLVALLLVLPLAWWLGRWFAFEGRGAIAASLALLGLVPVVAYAVRAKLTEELVLGDDHSERGDAHALLAIGLLAIGGVVLATWLATAIARASPERSLRVVAIVAWTITTVCLVGAAYRTALHPDADGWISSLPIVGEVPAFEDLATPPMAVPPPLVADGITVRRLASCMELEVTTVGGSMTRHEIFDCDRQVIRRDERHDWWLFESHEGARPLEARDDSNDDYVPVRAFRPPMPSAIPILPRDVTDALAPPHGWTLGALVAWLASILVAWLALRQQAKVPRVQAYAFAVGALTLGAAPLATEALSHLLRI